MICRTVGAPLTDCSCRGRMEGGASLPPKYRLPVVLRDIEGRSYDEVAEILELGLGTTKSRISRARGMLREKLSGYLEN